MCVDERQKKCCGCFSLTVGTIILGVFYLLASIWEGLVGVILPGSWASFAC